MTILGLHHVTLVCRNAARTVQFYTDVLGLRLVKKTVNFDDPFSYHLYFGDETGRPSTLVTFFEWPQAPQGRRGVGATHHIALSVATPEAQLRWKRRLQDHRVRVTGPYDRTYFRSIYFQDPDGIIIEIATRGPGFAVDEPPDRLGEQVIHPRPELTRGHRDEAAIEATTWPEPVGAITPDMAIQGLHHVTAFCSDIKRTARFYTELLGVKLIKRTFNYDDPSGPHWYFGDAAGSPGTIMTYFGYSAEEVGVGRIGAGLTHHVAFAVQDRDEQQAYRERLEAAGVQVTPIIDRLYFTSIYFRDPDGHILEIATLGPGMLVDEPAEALGQRLVLPPWLEPEREQIVAALRPL